MSIEIARSFFVWCSVIDYAILLVWAALVLQRWVKTNTVQRLLPKRKPPVSMSLPQLYS